MPRKLHVGGKEKADGWEILNANPGPDVDHNCNAIDLNIFEDGTFSELYASHILEHFDYVEEVGKALSEWHRVLEPKGKIYIGVPDLDSLAEMLCDKANYSMTDRFGIMRIIFGGHVDQYDYHYTGFNFEILSAYLRETGFVDIEKMQNFGLFQDTSNMVFKGKPVSLNVIAYKA